MGAFAKPWMLAELAVAVIDDERSLMLRVLERDQNRVGGRRRRRLQFLKPLV